MKVRHTLAVVAVADFDTSHAWYERFFDAPATNVPMPGSLAEWRVTSAGWLQLHVDASKAGSSFVNFAVDHLASEQASLRSRGIDAGEIVAVSKGVELCSIQDPDGNAITLIGNFREEY